MTAILVESTHLKIPNNIFWFENKALKITDKRRNIERMVVMCRFPGGQVWTVQTGGGAGIHSECCVPSLVAVDPTDGNSGRGSAGVHRPASGHWPDGSLVESLSQQGVSQRRGARGRPRAMLQPLRTPHVNRTPRGTFYNFYFTLPNLISAFLYCVSLKK